MVPEQIKYHDPFSSDTKKHKRLLLASSCFSILLGWNVLKIEKLPFFGGEVTARSEDLLFVAFGCAISYLLVVFILSSLPDFFFWYLEYKKQKGKTFTEIAPELYDKQGKLLLMYPSTASSFEKLRYRFRNLKFYFFRFIARPLIMAKVGFDLIFPIIVAAFSLDIIDFGRRLFSLL